MIDLQQLIQWKKEWRELLTDSIARALGAMEEHLPAGSSKHNILIALRARLNDANQGRMMGTVSNEDLQLEYNRIRLDLLTLIDGLAEDDFRPAPLGQAGGGPQRGVLLHKIPAKMQVGKEEECIIRLAYERAVIARDLELDENVELKEISISKVMHAELIDPNPEPAFAIRTFSDAEQFLQKGEYTEWKYYVRPLREGTFALLLKVSVVEVVEGKERRRNLSWEEQVQIVTEAAAVEPAAFKASGISFAYRPEPAAPLAPQPAGGAVKPEKPIQTTGGGSRGLDFDEIRKMYDPGGPEMPAAPQPSAPSPGRRRAMNIRRLSIAATVLIVIGVALAQLQLFTTESRSPEESVNPGQVDIDKGAPTDTLEAPEGLIGKYPDSGQAEEALWELARKTGERQYYEKYLQQYPEGKYAEEARRVLQ